MTKADERAALARKHAEQVYTHLKSDIESLAPGIYSKNKWITILTPEATRLRIICDTVLSEYNNRLMDNYFANYVDDMLPVFRKTFIENIFQQIAPNQTPKDRAPFMQGLFNKITNPEHTLIALSKHENHAALYIDRIKESITQTVAAQFPPL